MKVLCGFILLALFSIKSYGNPIFIEVYRCNENTPSVCILKDLLIDDKGHFMPKSKNPNTVTEVQLMTSTMPILTSDICDAFPKLQKLRLGDVSLKSIEKGALDSCTELTEVYLEDNLLSELDKDLFRENKLLTRINLNNNKLKSIPENLFNGLSNLQTVKLNANQISRLPSEMFEGLESMYRLEVGYNPLLSLEVEEFKEKMPNLRSLVFVDLDLSCDRMSEIKNFCNDYSIDMDYVEGLFSDRVRSYTVSSILYKIEREGYYNQREIRWNCLSNEQHEREILFREKLPRILSATNFETITSDMQQKFNDLNDQYEMKIAEMKNKTEEIDSTYLKKIFEAQTFMLNLIKEVKENQEKMDARIQRLEGFDENL